MSSSAYPLPVPYNSSDRRIAFPGNWSRLVAFLTVGYLCMSRSFAYLGLPWFNLYIGEISLAAFMLFGPRSKQGRWLRVARRVRGLKRIESLLLLFLLYGGFEAIRGILQGFPAFTAVRDTAFNYYPLFLLLGVWVGLQDEGFLRRLIRALAWWNGCYGLAYVLVLSWLPWTMPGTEKAASIVPLFTEPYGSALALLGLLAFEPRLRRVWHLLALNAVVMLWVQVRAEWVGFMVGLVVFSWCTRRIKPLMAAGGLVIALLAVMLVADVSLPSPEGRGGKFSVRELVARAVAPVDKNLASDLSSAKNVHGYAGTAEWRLVMWAGIWGQVHASLGSAVFGLGYGYPIANLNPLIEPGTFLQSPHDDFFYALGYTGWIGVVFFALLQLELGRLLLRGYKITGQTFGLVGWACMLATSLFEAFFESPFGAIPFYLLAGIALAPALVKRRSSDGLARKGFASCL